MAITRGLGIQYLWIDSLCIIQDDLSDWETESSRMANVFSELWLNLAIMYAVDSSVGCFIDRTCRQPHGVWGMKTYFIPATESLHPPIFVRPAFSQSHWDMRNPEKMWAFKAKQPPLVSNAQRMKRKRSKSASLHEAGYIRNVFCPLAHFISDLLRWFGIV